MALQENIALPSGFKLNNGNYIIDRKISVGGFSIVYLSHNKNGIPVAIKEYMPASIKSRINPLTSNIEIDDKEDKDMFEQGMKSFLREVEAISKLNDPAIIQILNFFTENNTAYIVMKYENGQTLQQIIQHRFDIVSNENMLIKYFLDIAHGISILHKNNMLHLDIKPSNIMIRTDHSAMLLDFGTSRLEVIGKSMSPLMHTPGYAALEQHKNFYNPNNIGPWTDLYSLGATFYSCIERRIPLPASKRFNEDHVLDFKKRWFGEYNERLLDIIEKLMELDYKKRYPTALKLIEDIKKCKKNKMVHEVDHFFRTMS